MKDSSNPRFMVDFLVRDSDLYFVAFRRHLFLTEEEEEEARLLEKEEDGASSLQRRRRGGGEEWFGHLVSLHGQG